QNAFVAKVDPASEKLFYCTYLGGERFDEGHDIAVDAEGHAYVTGITMSSKFPTTPGAFQTDYIGSRVSDWYNVFVTKLAPGGDSLVYSTLLAAHPELDDYAEAFGQE